MKIIRERKRKEICRRKRIKKKKRRLRVINNKNKRMTLRRGISRSSTRASKYKFNRAK